jgi:hypothetical protein
MRIEVRQEFEGSTSNPLPEQRTYFISTKKVAIDNFIAKQ